SFFLSRFRVLRRIVRRRTSAGISFSRAEAVRERRIPMGRLRWFVVGVAVATAVSAAAQAALRDVPANHWAGSAIRKSVAMGLMAAPGGKFQPDRPVTRAELAVVLV